VRPTVVTATGATMANIYDDNLGRRRTAPSHAPPTTTNGGPVGAEKKTFAAHAIFPSLLWHRKGPARGAPHGSHSHGGDNGKHLMANFPSNTMPAPAQCCYFTGKKTVPWYLVFV
jgi:hypothetical protein